MNTPMIPTCLSLMMAAVAASILTGPALGDDGPAPDDARSAAALAEVEILTSGEDCNENGMPDDEDIANCVSSDCNGNGIPDECDIAADPEIDLDFDGVPDSCEVYHDLRGINPRATYLRTQDDPDAVDATPIDLIALGAQAGDFIRLERLGDFGSTIGNNPGGDDEDFEDMVVVFSATDELLAADQPHRVPGAIDAGDDFETPPTFFGDFATDIDEDFFVLITTLCVPDGATHLFVSPVDSHFGDNFDRNRDFSLRITVVPDFADCNENRVPDHQDIDNGTSEDCNGNGIPDECDVADERSSDINSNGIPDECETIAFDVISVQITVHNDLASGTIDSDAVALQLTVMNDLTLSTQYTDAVAVELTVMNDLTSGTIGNDVVARQFTVFNLGLDCNENDIPDDIDIRDGTSQDCNGNEIPDECEIPRERGEGFFCDVGCDPDCNDNGTPDSCDIADGTSVDCDGNGVPDECQPDCNENGIADACDIRDGTSEDCNENRVPDECEIPVDSGGLCEENCDADCNENGVPDSCDIADGTSSDCDGNGRPDECQISRDFGEGFFCDENCDEDCNANGIPDICDIDNCPADDPDCDDCNANLRPDSCDIADGRSADLDENGIPDECVGWDGDFGTLWSDSENWATGDVPGDEGPGPVESVVLDLSLDPPNRDVELDISVSIDSLVIEDQMSLTMSGGDLHIDAANGIVANDALNIGDGVSIIADADMFLRGAHPITLTGDAAVISSSLAEHVVTNLGTVNGRGRFAASLRNRGIIRADDPEGALVIADDTFPKTNQGILRADAGGRLRIEADIRGTGNLATDGGVISIPSAGGAVTVEGGTLTIDDVDFLGGAGVEVDRDTRVLLSGDMRIIRGRYGAAPGAEDVSAFSSARSVTIQGGARGGQPGDMELTGDMRVDVAEDLVLDGAGTGPCGSGFRGNDTPPILRHAGFMRISIGNDIRFVESVEVRVGEQAGVSAGGDFDNRSIRRMCFDWPGTLELNGVELQRFEVAGENRGADRDGFDDNFAMGTLELAPDATVRLTDGFDNQQNGDGPCDEVLYVDTLIVGEGATIEENSCTLYYRTLDDRGGNLPGLGTRILRICVREPAWLCDGDVDGDGQVNPVDSGLIQAAFGSTEPGDLCQFDMDCDGQINPVDAGIVQSLFGTCDDPRDVCP